MRRRSGVTRWLGEAEGRRITGLSDAGIDAFEGYKEWPQRLVDRSSPRLRGKVPAGG
jgi:hypothetical protein